MQPYRDLCIGIAAKYIGENYPDSVFIDIGAIVGDTASIMATYASNKLILIEASDFFYDVLKLNSSLFSNETTLINEIVSNGETVYGKPSHWGGTAFSIQALRIPSIFKQ